MSTRKADIVIPDHFVSHRRSALLEHDTVKQGRTMSAPDVVIAATALIHKLVLMTDNRRDFPTPQLAMYSLH